MILCIDLNDLNEENFQENTFGILIQDTGDLYWSATPFVYPNTGQQWVMDKKDLLSRRSKKEKVFKKYVNGFQIRYI